MRAFDPSQIIFPKGYEEFKFPERTAPVALEIGAGVGWHAVAYACAHPEVTMLAVEHSRERFEKLQRRCAAQPELTNVWPVHADVESFVVHLVPAHSLDRVIVLYPNPYPKASQANKRWHEMPFMNDLIIRMKKGAVLELATNEFDYAADFHDRMIETWGLTVFSNERVSNTADPDFKPRTHFEKKYFERGEMLHLMQFQKS